MLQSALEKCGDSKLVIVMRFVPVCVCINSLLLAYWYLPQVFTVIAIYWEKYTVFHNSHILFPTMCSDNMGKVSKPLLKSGAESRFCPQSLKLTAFLCTAVNQMSTYINS